MIRNAYLKRISSRLEDLDEEIDRFRRKAEGASGEAKALCGRSLATLRPKADEVRRRIREVREAGAADWGRLKEGTEDALEELRQAVDAAIRQIRKTGSNDP